MPLKKMNKHRLPIVNQILSPNNLSSVNGGRGLESGYNQYPGAILIPLQPYPVLSPPKYPKKPEREFTLALGENGGSFNDF